MSPPSATNDSWYFPFRDDDRDYQSPRALYCRTVFLSPRNLYTRFVWKSASLLARDTLFLRRGAISRPNKIETFIHGNRNITREISVYLDNYIRKMYCGIESVIFLNVLTLFWKIPFNILYIKVFYSKRIIFVFRFLDYIPSRKGIWMNSISSSDRSMRTLVAQLVDRRAEKVQTSHLGGRQFSGKEYLQNHGADHSTSDGYEVQF